jgi:hypothetical protein
MAEIDIDKFVRTIAQEVIRIMSATTPTVAPPKPKELEGRQKAIKQDLAEQYRKKIKTTGAEGDWQNISSSDLYNNVVNVDKALKEGNSPKVHDFLKIVAYIIKRDFPGKKAHVTNAFRSPADQVAIMRRNYDRNDGDQKLDKPVVWKVNGKPTQVTTEGTNYLAKLYGPNVGVPFGTELEKGALDKEKWTKYWSEHRDVHLKGNRSSHISGGALDFRSKTKPFMKEVLNKAKEFADIKAEYEPKPPHWHVEVRSIKRALPAATSSLKTAAVVPFDPLVDQAWQSIKTRSRASAQQGERVLNLDEIDVIPVRGGHPAFAWVKSDEPNNVYVAIDKIKQEVHSWDNPQEQMEEILIGALRHAIGHELGHLTSKFQPGESAAEQKAHQIEQPFAQEMPVAFAQSLIGELESQGWLVEAHLIRKAYGIKVAYVEPQMNPQELAQSLLRIIYHFAQKVKPESQRGYLENLRRKLYTVNVMEMMNKRKNPGAGVGASVSIMKNILGGEEPGVVQEAMRQVVMGINRLIS